MTTAVEAIVEQYRLRRLTRGPVIARMEDLRRHYNADVVLPLPELDRNERPGVANLVAQGLDQTAMRISSTLPDVYYPPVKPGNDTSEEWARKRRLANLGWWQMNRYNIRQRRRARWLIGYSSAPVLLRPDFARRIPAWQPRDPLGTFPAETTDPDDLCPPDVIFAFTRSLQWLKANHPDKVALLYKGEKPRSDDAFDVVEYVDDTESVLVAVGKRPPLWQGVPNPDEVGTGALPHVELDRVINRAGRCCAVVPGRVTLDRPQGQFDGILGLWQNQARLMALSLIEIERGVFAEMWVESFQGGTQGQIVRAANARAGIPGIVKGGKLVPITPQPGMQTGQAIDRLERAQRIGSGTPPEFGGESSSNIRTGRRGDAILSAVVDFPVQEAQEVLAAAAEEENKIAVALTKAHWGARTFSFYVDEKGRTTRNDYVPERHFENDNNRVSYPLMGADANGVTVRTGQAIGMGTMSKRRGMELDPMVNDPELEHDRIVAEGLEQSLLAAIEQQVAQGQLGPAEVAQVAKAVRENRSDLAAAVLAVHQAQQQLQATSGVPGTPEGPVPAGAPEAQPGLGGPNQAGAAPGPAIPPEGPSMVDLVQQLRGLHAVQSSARQAAVA